MRMFSHYINALLDIYIITFGIMDVVVYNKDTRVGKAGDVNEI